MRKNDHSEPIPSSRMFLEGDFVCTSQRISRNGRKNFIPGNLPKQKLTKNAYLRKPFFYGRAFKPTIWAYETPNERNPGIVPENLRPVVKYRSGHHL